MQRLFISFVLVFVVLSGRAHAARLDTSFVFSTVETRHFAIHFHQGLEEAARRLAAMAEEVHGELAAEFLWEPHEKTQ
ncbi:MAG TPA: hypothetical protein VI389_11525, partial [Geobacteraceae bacterium]